MDLMRYPLDLILVSLSLCLIAGYHAYICYKYSNPKPPITNLGVTMMRRTWLQEILLARSEDDEETKGLLVIQILRNTLMPTILSASLAIAINSSLAALANNTYSSSHLHQHAAFGSQTGPTLALKYVMASLLLLFSFLCSTMAVWCIVEADFLITASGEFFDGHAQRALERGWVLAVVGKRVLYITFPFLLWLLGPVPMAVSAVAMIWMFYNLDLSELSVIQKFSQ